MTKQADRDKIIVTAKLNFPFEAYVTTIFFVFIFCVILKQMLFDNKIEIEWWLLLFGCLVGFSILLRVFRIQYKKLTIFNNKLEIKPLFSLRTRTIYFDNIKGFELFETAIMGGIGYNLRLIISDDKKIVFPRDNYSNYDKIINGLHKSSLPFFGQKNMETKYKNAYGSLLKWSAILFPFIYGLFLFLKSIK